jgi:hypothetical protein
VKIREFENRPKEGRGTVFRGVEWALVRPMFSKTNRF